MWDKVPVLRDNAGLCLHACALDLYMCMHGFLEVPTGPDPSYMLHSHVPEHSVPTLSTPEHTAHTESRSASLQVDEQLYRLQFERADLLKRIDEDQDDLNGLMQKHKDLIAQVRTSLSL